MNIGKTKDSAWVRWLCICVFCCSVATAGLARAQDKAEITSPGEAVAVSASQENAGNGAASAETAAANLPANQAQARPSGATSASRNPGWPTVRLTAAGRDVSERTLFLNILRDQKDLWLFPTKFSHENHWLPSIVVVGVTASLLAADSHDAPYFRQTKAFGDFNGAFSGNITNAETLIAPASFYVVGLLDKDPYARKTGMLAAEALADVTILSSVIKGVTRQVRPEAIPAYGDFTDTFFKANRQPLSSSFPSGHAISAFAVATVIAERYGKRHRWVPFAAYGAAALIGFSRVTLSAHFPSDVFLGAALGYAVARFDVMRTSGLPQQVP